MALMSRNSIPEFGRLNIAVCDLGGDDTGLQLGRLGDLLFGDIRSRSARAPGRDG